jgi:hypothetical protein
MCCEYISPFDENTFFYPNLTDSTYLPGCITIMEDIWMMVGYVEIIQRKKRSLQ